MKKEMQKPAAGNSFASFKRVVRAQDLILPERLNFENYDFPKLEAPCLGDYSVGEKIDHIDGVTIEEAEHMLATRLWQNTSKVHFDSTIRPDGKRLIYGGHVISLAMLCRLMGLPMHNALLRLTAEYMPTLVFLE